MKEFSIASGKSAERDLRIEIPGKKLSHKVRHWICACAKSCMRRARVTRVPLSLTRSHLQHQFIMIHRPWLILPIRTYDSYFSFIPDAWRGKQCLIPSPESAARKTPLPLWLLSEIRALSWDKAKLRFSFFFLSLTFQGPVNLLTFWPAAPWESAYSSLPLMRQATVTVTSELSACNICHVFVLANVTSTRASVTAHSDF